ncbi:hypothetical protein [Blastococcus xanthinilyticus]|uniref:Uncharacterized protein n=1 Tax=Blastococcus xanthinilyticus TaxID=1564164 RepID=A0A5S5CQB9_9ACTN|nr:hypothetical protein [Blastococcus xanthinilyticus]TYP82079.1 hypothetical protein BD833_12063 [Blastococcus xanthinilyticus]
MPQSSAPLVGVNLSDLDWRDSFGDEAGVLRDLDGTAYRVTLPTDSDVLRVGSTTQRSIARVAGFVHRIPAGETEPLTIPVASGTARTDIIALRYDPEFKGEPGPVRLARIAGTATGLPNYDDAAPGVEDLPLWAITRQPGQSLSQAMLRRLFPRLAPGLELPEGAPLPISSPLGTVLQQGAVTYRRQLDSSGVPTWARTSGGAVAHHDGAWYDLPNANDGTARDVWGANPQILGEIAIPDPGIPYRVAALAACEAGSTQASTRWDLQLRLDSATNGEVLALQNGGRWLEGSNAQHFNLTSLPSRAVLTGTHRIYVVAAAGFGSALGYITPYQRKLSAVVYAT